MSDIAAGILRALGIDPQDVNAATITLEAGKAPRIEITRTVRRLDEGATRTLSQRSYDLVPRLDQARSAPPAAAPALLCVLHRYPLQPDGYCQQCRGKASGTLDEEHAWRLLPPTDAGHIDAWLKG